MISKAGKLDSSDLTQKKTALKLKHKKQLADFDKKTDEMVASADADFVPSLQVKHARARLELRERQLNELSGSMKDFVTADELKKDYAEQAEKAGHALQEFKQKTMYEMSKKIEDVKRLRREKADEQKRVMDEEVRRLEKQIEFEKEAENNRETEKESEMEILRKRKLQEKTEAERVYYLNNNFNTI